MKTTPVVTVSIRRVLGILPRNLPHGKPASNCTNDMYQLQGVLLPLLCPRGIRGA